MKKKFFSIIASGLFILLISSIMMGCKANLPGKDDPQGASEPSKMENTK